jgi:hypothetical protein
MGGPVSPGQNYVVGEKGPEIFSPSQSGKIIPGYEIGGVIRYGKDSYGRKGNPAARAAQERAKAERAAAYVPAPVETPERKPGPLTGSKTTVVGNGGVRTNKYGVQGSLPYMPGLTLGHAALNRTQAALLSAAKQIEMSLFAFGTSVKKDALMTGRVIKYSGDQLVVGARMLPGQIKSALTPLVTGIKYIGSQIATTAKAVGAQIKAAGSYVKGWAASPPPVAPGAYGGATLGQNFAANARYTTSNMLHPVQYLKNKGMINPATFGQGAIGSTVGMMGGMAVGGMVGEKIGGQNGAMIGSMGGMMAGQSIVKGIGGKIAAKAAASAGAAGLASAGFGATAAAAAGLVAPLAAVTAAVYVGYKAWKHYKEGQTLNISTFGLTAEAAKKANLRFTDFGSKIKDTIQDSKDMVQSCKVVDIEQT